MRGDKAFVIVVASMMAALVVVFCTLPRSRYSELEKRELRTFPEYSGASLRDGSFTAEVSNWFSDSEPFRDAFMTASMQLKSWMAMKPLGAREAVTFHAPEPTAEEEGSDPDALEPTSPTPAVTAPKRDQRDIQEYHHNVDANAKMENAGVIVMGTAPNARALMAFKNRNKGEKAFAQTVNTYQRVFAPDVQVYCMIIPTAVEYYCPESARSCSDPEFPILTALYSLIDTAVQVVDLYMVMGEHVDEDIYFRTDHHWSPLGAYYAARQFAEVAGVEVPDLADFEPHAIEGYVGSMYGFSKDINVKKSPETFVYYTPKEVAYSTTYVKYQLDKDYQIVKEERPSQGDFFVKVSSPGAAYCTFMGTDSRITKVETEVDNHRRLLILKDSFGNALPGYLFGSFEEIHVIDFRYFTHNLKKYVHEHGITDLLMTNNISQVCSGAIGSAYNRFLQQ
ncbi:MAG: hypothetical protein J5831_00815 [Bacteroidales bacterium]|nr:hypothetical protein [Bacteroidales bacterium]